MTTAKELSVKKGDVVKLKREVTEAIMTSFGSWLGVSTESMIGRGWVCCDHPGRVYKFNPLDDNGNPVKSFIWNFAPNEDAFQPLEAKEGGVALSQGIAIDDLRKRLKSGKTITLYQQPKKDKER